VNRLIETAVGGNQFATLLGKRMVPESGTRFKVWVDHLVVAGTPGLARTLVSLGYQRQSITYAVGVPVYAHAGGIFPRIAVVSSGGSADGSGVVGVRDVAIKMESIAAFSRAHDLGLEILGYPLGPYRSALIPGERTNLVV